MLLTITLAGICLFAGIIIGNLTKKNTSVLLRVSNKTRHVMANDHYWHLRVFKDTEQLDLLLTDSQITKAHERALRNPEDIP